MSVTNSAKRQRADNYESDDIELLCSLINEYNSELDSQKIEEKKKAWDSIWTKFNANCTGVKRDLSSLKMKVKNMKAQAIKKPKIEIADAEDSITEIHVMTRLEDDAINHHDGNLEAEETDPNQSHSESLVSKTRKRCKKFTKAECDLLVSLFDKHCQGLDSSCSANSIKRRSEAWTTLTDDFNDQQNTGVKRDENELKIKIKNIKAMRVKTEPVSSDNTPNSRTSIQLTPIKIIEDKKPIQQQQLLNNEIQHISSEGSSRVRNMDIVTEALYGDDEIFEEEYIQPMPMQHKEDDKELERVRRENIMLKNAVLRKKERLLELQIALAERNLRRQI